MHSFSICAAAESPISSLYVDSLSSSTGLAPSITVSNVPPATGSASGGAGSDGGTGSGSTKLDTGTIVGIVTGVVTLVGILVTICLKWPKTISRFLTCGTCTTVDDDQPPQLGPPSQPYLGTHSQQYLGSPSPPMYYNQPHYIQ